MSVQVTVAGAGRQATTLTVPEGASLALVLDEAQVNTSDTNAAVNGTRVSEPEQHEVQNGDQVAITPRDAKLG